MRNNAEGSMQQQKEVNSAIVDKPRAPRFFETFLAAFGLEKPKKTLGPSGTGAYLEPFELAFVRCTRRV